MSHADVEAQKPLLRCAVITLFPQSFSMLQDSGITGRAHQSLWQLFTINPRDYSENKHRRVDDRPYGGGPGMVMQAPPLRDSILAAKAILNNNHAPVVYMSPQGYTFSQNIAQQLAQGDLTGLMPEFESACHDYIFLCGRYEGVDERLLDKYVNFEISIGDYILSGGEIAAMVIIDAMVRLLPGACGHVDSAAEDSFSDSLLDHEQYTRPVVFEGVCVPPVLQSGDHQAIEAWRQANALERTQRLRPDLLVARSEKKQD